MMFPRIFLSFGSICFSDPAEMLLQCLKTGQVKLAEECRPGSLQLSSPKELLEMVVAEETWLSAFDWVAKFSHLNLTQLALLSAALLFLAAGGARSLLWRMGLARAAIFTVIVAVSGYQGAVICLITLSVNYGLWGVASLLVCCLAWNSATALWTVVSFFLQLLCTFKVIVQRNFHTSLIPAKISCLRSHMLMGS